MRSKRRDQIDHAKKIVLVHLDRIGTCEVTFGQLLKSLKNKGFNSKNLKKYVGILFDDDYIDINSTAFKDRAQIKAEVNAKTRIQITSAGQDFAYPPKREGEVKSIIKAVLISPWTYTIVGGVIVWVIIYLIFGK